MSLNLQYFAAPAVTALALLSAGPSVAADVDADAAQALAKSSNCLKCHAIDKKKDGPSFKETATKFKGQAGAEDEVYKRMTVATKVKVDGEEQEHQVVKSKDEAAIRNLGRWILSR